MITEQKATNELFYSILFTTLQPGHFGILCRREERGEGRVTDM